MNSAFDNSGFVVASDWGGEMHHRDDAPSVRRVLEQGSPIAQVGRKGKNSSNRYKRMILLGWSISALVHGSAAVTATALALYSTSMQTVPYKEPFRWEVSVLAAPQNEPIVADGIQPQEEALVAETDHQTMPEVRPLEHVAEYSDQSAESVEREAVEPAVSPDLSSYAVPPASEQSITQPDHFTTKTAMAVANPAASFMPPPDVDAQRDAERLQVETQLELPTILQRPQVVTRTLVNRTILPDYTWLRDTLRTKLERIKVYPSSAKAGHVQGRVIVQVNIQGDGRIVHSEIVLSSGYPVLDQAALDILQAASPLRLPHRLDGNPIVMLVPLNYQLE